MPSTPASTAAPEGELARASAYQNLGMNSPDQCMAHDNKSIMVKKYPSTIDVPVIRDTLPGHMAGATSHCQGVRSQCLYRYSPCRWSLCSTSRSACRSSCGPATSRTTRSSPGRLSIRWRCDARHSHARRGCLGHGPRATQGTNVKRNCLHDVVHLPSLADLQRRRDGSCLGGGRPDLRPACLLSPEARHCPAPARVGLHRLLTMPRHPADGNSGG